MELTVAVTGASGSIYAQRTLMHMAASGAVERVNLIMSQSALTVARVEMGAKIEPGDSRAVNEWVGLPADSRLIQFHRLVLVVRETPYNSIHLQNMLRLAHAGARVMPASPGFYHRPQTIEQLVDHLVFRLLDQFDIPHPTGTRWKGEEGLRTED